MILDLNIAYDRQKLRSYSEHLLRKQCVVEIKEKHRQRTLSQNSFLHVLLAYFGSEVGMTVEQVKYDIFKRTVNKDIFFRGESRLGGDFPLLRSTSDLDKEEMSRAIDRFRRWSEEEAGIPLPEATDYDALLEIEKQIAMCERYL